MIHAIVQYIFTHAQFIQADEPAPSWVTGVLGSNVLG